MAIFNSHVSLAEGKSDVLRKIIYTSGSFAIALMTGGQMS
jgi:hypothetical protein